MTGTPHGVMVIEVRGQTLWLHPERALVWPAAGMLLVADVHLGKEAVFRDRGVAVPEGATRTDLERLERLLEQCRCTHLVVLGDLFHALPAEPAGLAGRIRDWRARLAGVRVSVIAGNHDRAGVQAHFAADFDWQAAAMTVGPFSCHHEPPAMLAGTAGAADPAGHAGADPTFTLAGHLHPVFRLRRRGDRLRLPVFWRRETGIVLPAFGSFTGGWNVEPVPSDRLYAVGPDAVIGLPPARRRR